MIDKVWPIYRVSPYPPRRKPTPEEIRRILGVKPPVDDKPFEEALKERRDNAMEDTNAK